MPEKSPACPDFHAWALQWKFKKNIFKPHAVPFHNIFFSTSYVPGYESKFKPVQLILSDSFGAAMGSRVAEHLENSEQWAAAALATSEGRHGNNACEQ